MDKEFKLRKLEEDLVELRRSNHSSWDTYGS